MWLLQNRMIFAKFAGQSVSTDKKFSNRSKKFAVEDVTTNSWSTAITVPSEQKMVYKSLMETLVYQFNLTKTKTKWPDQEKFALKPQRSACPQSKYRSFE